MSRIKTITVDDYYTTEGATAIANVVSSLPFVEMDFCRQIEQFNMVPPDIDDMFRAVLNMKMVTDLENSGFFRVNKPFIHFESFDSPEDWMFVVAIQESIFNVYENKQGQKTALDGYALDYQNFFQWNLISTHILQPGQGILFRPWLFHSFDSGVIQVFKTVEIL